jgi:MFS family permease
MFGFNEILTLHNPEHQDMKSHDRLLTFTFVNACIANFFVGFSFHMLAPTLPFYLVEHFHANTGITGLIISSYSVAALFTRPFAGYFADSMPRKNLYILSFLFFVSLYVGYPFVASLAAIVLLRMLHGIAWGLTGTSGNTLAIDIMPVSRRGEGIGYFGMMLNLAMATGPLVGLFLYEYYSFSHIFYGSLIAGSIGFAAALFIKAPENIKITETPLTLDRLLLIKGIPMGINLLFVATTYGMVVSFAAMYGKSMHIANTGMFFTLFALGIGFSRIFSGKLIDNGKLHTVNFRGISLLSASFFVFAFGRNAIFFFTSALFMGIGFGVLFPAFQTLFLNIAPASHRGTANSTYFLSFDLGIGTGMVLAGNIANRYNFSKAFLFAAILNIAAVTYYALISRKCYDRNRVIF